ncbi:GGDEF domain-containing protein [Butyrivibrio sp. FCS014]|uniref:GGDEF domain-containing protein n=1 Tax=Butyrivibrio sp. FCS014 TaxID=1408304 RepID=UPI000464A6CB|nr:GGDEF domain-containing protein [Butyrivibrio sp. FCS014]
MDNAISLDYKEFLKNNRARVNGYLNIVLWSFVLTGPAIALGVKGGIFPDITYGTCIAISAGVIILAAIHRVLIKLNPSSKITCVYALLSLNILIVYMNYSHVNIYLTWFLVPLLSILFCSKSLYYFSIALNFVLMLGTTWVTAPYHAEKSLKYTTAMECFADRMSGFVIESIIMSAAGYAIVKLGLRRFETLFEQYRLIGEHDMVMKEKMEIQESMTEIYENVNLIDFVNNTEMSLRDPEQQVYPIDMTKQTQTRMNKMISRRVMSDQLEEFRNYTNITTVRSRLSHRKLISADFIDVVNGWFRAQYITVEATPDGIPTKVIYTTRTVDDEKRREENLIRISMTDEMTRLFNRRCYDEDLKKHRYNGMSTDFVIFSVDVNGLKKVNDTKGHAAGDELIKGAANCIALSIGNKGKVYRTGGDEFMSIVHTNDPEKLRGEIHERIAGWSGTLNDSVRVSVGYASVKDHPDASIDQLERIADSDMYDQKEKFYRESGIDRRR